VSEPDNVTLGGRALASGAAPAPSHAVLRLLSLKTFADIGPATGLVRPIALKSPKVSPWSSRNSSIVL
jgi:hypothetical protein